MAGGAGGGGVGRKGRHGPEASRRTRERAADASRSRPPQARDLALQALHRIDTRGAYASLALSEVLDLYAAVDKRERALATELTYGVVRRLKTLDYLIGMFSARPVAAIDPWVRNALRLAVYQIEHLDRVPAPAAVNAAVEQVRRCGRGGLVGFANGVLRGFLRGRDRVRFPDPETDPVAHLAVVYSHPEWLVRRWLERYGFAATRDLLEFDNTAAPVTVRVNRLRTSPEELARRLAAEGVQARPGRWLQEVLVIEGFPRLEDLPSFRAGLFQVQDEAAVLVGRVVDPRPGDTVLDVAAAPGGKCTHLAELMDDRGRVIANDPHPGRLALIEENCRRLGIRCVEMTSMDGRALPERFAGRAGRVLLDAPCSGLGVLRRRPDARWRKEEARIVELAALQRQLLAAAARCVAPGGVLVYSTCTTEPEENGQVVDAFLADHPGFVAESLARFLPPALAGEAGVPEGRLQLLPHRHGVDGFFIARLRRRQ